MNTQNCDPPTPAGEKHTLTSDGNPSSASYDWLVSSAEQTAHHRFGTEFAKEVGMRAARYAADLKTLRAVGLAGPNRKLRERQHRLLKSYDARLVCLVRSLPRGISPTQEWVVQMASELDAWTDPGEPVSAWAEAKSSGTGYRPLCKFGPKRRALQTLVGDVLQAQHGEEPTNYLRKGMGADRAASQISSLMQEGVTDFFVLVDIQDFYRSVQQKGLEETLGLPKKVFDNCVLISPDVSLSIHPSTSTHTPHHAFDSAVRQGLPQGSRTSSIIAGLLLGPALRSLTSADRIVVHGDDAAVAACSLKEAEALKKAMPEVFASHPAGPFCLKRCEVASVGDGFNFLKYRHRRDPTTEIVRQRPSYQSYERFKLRVRHMTKTTNPLTLDALLDLYAKTWSSAFPLWEPNELSWILLSITTELAKQGAFATQCKAKEADGALK